MPSNVELLSEYFGRALLPRRRTYIVADEMTMTDSMKLGETIEVIEYPPLGGWPDMPRLWRDKDDS